MPYGHLLSQTRGYAATIDRVRIFVASCNSSLCVVLHYPDAERVLGLLGLKLPAAPALAASISVTSVGVMKKRSSCTGLVAFERTILP